MKILKLKTSVTCPSTEYSHNFLQGMLNRMAMSFHTYGAVSAAFPEKVNAVESARIRLDKYLATGNTEFLMDVANFAMIEFMRPRHPKAHFLATDNSTSPGRVWDGDGDREDSQRANDGTPQYPEK